MVYKCCVRGCKISATNGLHSFPANKSIAQKWIEAIKNNELINLLNENKLARSFRRVCKNHFKKSDFVQNSNGQLIPNSVPSLFLPDADTVVIMKENFDVFHKSPLCFVYLKESPKIKRSIPLKPPKRLQQTFPQTRRPNPIAFSNVTYTQCHCNKSEIVQIYMFFSWKLFHLYREMNHNHVKAITMRMSGLTSIQ